MAKLFKRLGTKSYKFSVEIYMKSLEINVSDSEKCKCLLMYTRGDHKVEGKKPVPIISKNAVFSDVFKQTSTLYYSKKHKKFLEKTAQIDILLIFKEDKKMAGFVKFDLASYPNNDIKNAYESLKLEKSPDKNARLNFEIRINGMEETEENAKDNSFIQATTSKKKSQNPKKTNSDKKQEKNKKKDSESEESGSSYDSESSESDKSETKSDNTGNKNKKNVKKVVNLSNNSGGKIIGNNSSSLDKIPEILQKEKKNTGNEDQEINLDLFQTRKIIPKNKTDFSKILTEPSNLNLSNNMKSLLTSTFAIKDQELSKTLIKPDKDRDTYFDNNLLNKSNITIKTQQDIINGGDIDDGTNASTSVEISVNRIKVLEGKLHAKIKENLVLVMNTQKLEKENVGLKQTIESSQKELKEKNELIESLQEQLSCNNKAVELQIASYKSKLKLYEESNENTNNNIHNKSFTKSDLDKKNKEIATLQTHNKELEATLKELNEFFTDLSEKQKILIKENEELSKVNINKPISSKSRRETTIIPEFSASSPRKNTKFFLRESYNNQNDLETKMLEQDFELKSLKTEILDLKNELKLKELKIKELNLGDHSQSDLDRKQFEINIEHKERIIKDLQEELKLKNQTIKSYEKPEKNEKTQKNDDFYKKKIENLTEELYEKRKEIEVLSSGQKFEKTESESELARLSVENQNLQRLVKDLQGKINKNKIISDTSFSKETEDLKAKIKRQEMEISEMLERITKLSAEVQEKQKEMTTMQEDFYKKQSELKNFEETVQNFQNEIFQNKIKLAKVLNVAFESGGSELVDLIENAILEL